MLGRRTAGVADSLAFCGRREAECCNLELPAARCASSSDHSKTLPSIQCVFNHVPRFAHVRTLATVCDVLLLVLLMLLLLLLLLQQLERCASVDSTSFVCAAGGAADGGHGHLVRQ
eukprot:COSAG02_NODE_555_length_20407_cov_11.072878_20_plen_116_part_00